MTLEPSGFKKATVPVSVNAAGKLNETLAAPGLTNFEKWAIA
jgi:hypothetical protein